ncbi:hypothetical protein [Desmospora profundinema]|uniref:Secreted protein n=1 Tax=Desmospora profundinema TaxID=1571184 RepID=A0ABU1IJ93_9BACL|nr:hypothetical protein [Desmospora profundinema]MDR6224831.1 hypothetical protein [Desmospora profundinema]
MKWNTSTKWIVAGLACLVLVIGGYYAFMSGDSPAPHGEHAPEEKATEDHDGHGDHDGHADSEKSEVVPRVTTKGDQLVVSLEDDQGNPLDEGDLEITHERLMHLILVSRDLQEYHHLHPKPAKEGTFQVESPLKSGSYQVFVDIQPKDRAYVVEPLSLQLGEKSTPEAELKQDSDFTQTIRGTTVTMEPTTFRAGQPVTLDFSLEGGQPEPYLGALGHVVILDEKAQDFIHVHPTSDKETRFETQFDRPGMYKIWAEFKIDGEVNIYSYEIEVEG